MECALSVRDDLAARARAFPRTIPGRGRNVEERAWAGRGCHGQPTASFGRVRAREKQREVGQSGRLAWAGASCGDIARPIAPRLFDFERIVCCEVIAE